SEAAKNDLIRLHQYGIHKFGETLADTYFHAFFDQFEKISEQPYLFASVDVVKPEYRRCVLGIDSIYYRIIDNSVEIIRIIGRQDFRL
ncbi:type II toxin-antitoxin system RelE/ParE family toxin, partial [Salinimicrobium oceani]